MQIVFYILGSIAAALLIVAVPVLTIRAMALMSRLDETRKELAEFIIEGTLTAQHANRFMARSQESLDRLRHVAERAEKLLGMLQPAAAVGGLVAGARRIFGGGRAAETPPASNDAKENPNG